MILLSIILNHTNNEININIQKLLHFIHVVQMHVVAKMLDSKSQDGNSGFCHRLMSTGLVIHPIWLNIYWYQSVGSWRPPMKCKQ